MDGMSSDLRAALDFWRAVEVLDTLAEILANNPRLHSERAKIEEHMPWMSAFEVQLEAKAREVESDPRGWPELAALLRDQRPTGP
jgi:hypothetical protein